MNIEEQGTSHSYKIQMKANAHWLSFDEKQAAKILGQKAMDIGEQEYQRQLKYLMLRKSSDR